MERLLTCKKVFVTSVGLGAEYAEVQYRLHDAACRTRYAPVATARMLCLQGWQALVLVTRAAREKNYDALARELSDAGLDPAPVEIPDGTTEAEILAIFTTLTERIEAKSHVVLDVTFSFRHLPFVYLASLAYLMALREVKVDGIYYGAFDLARSRGGEAPILDLTPLLNLMGWYHGLRSFRESGDAAALGAQFALLVGALFRRGEAPVALGKAKDATQRLAGALAAALPLEIGLDAAAVRLAVRAACQDAHPSARLALDALVETVDPWVCDGPKKSLRLTMEELDRELRVAQWYADRGRLSSAVAILREWIVSAAILGSGDGRDWLDYGKRRHPTEGMLNALDYRARRGVATEDEKRVASLWKSVADLRNKLMHCGMTVDTVGPSAGEIQTLLKRCREAGVDSFRLPATPSRKLLVTPLGLSPGVLYSSLVRTEPDDVVVVTTAQAHEYVGPALERAGRPNLEPLVRIVQEPHTGFREVDRLLDAELRRRMIAAGDVVVNLTGGTTVMQYLCERVAAEAERLGVPVRRIALVDRRTPREQQAEPWVLGELVDLGGHAAEVDQ
jgi:hypothetical protein